MLSVSGYVQTDPMHSRNFLKCIFTAHRQNDVVVPATRLSSLGDRAFPVAGARAWNALPPPSVTSAPSLSSFRDFWRHFFSSDNCVNNTNYCVVVLKCFSTQHHVNLGELNWTENDLSEMQGSIKVPSLRHSTISVRMSWFGLNFTR